MSNRTTRAAHAGIKLGESIARSDNAQVVYTSMGIGVYRSIPIEYKISRQNMQRVKRMLLAKPNITRQNIEGKGGVAGTGGKMAALLIMNYRSTGLDQ